MPYLCHLLTIIPTEHSSEFNAIIARTATNGVGVLFAFGVSRSNQIMAKLYRFMTFCSPSSSSLGPLDVDFLLYHFPALFIALWHLLASDLHFSFVYGAKDYKNVTVPPCGPLSFRAGRLLNAWFFFVGFSLSFFLLYMPPKSLTDSPLVCRCDEFV